VDLLPAAGAIVGAVILSRFAWVIPMAYGSRALLPSLRRRDPYPPLGVPVVVSWAGMRGVVSLAVALALPEAFPGRDFILAVTFVVILVTVLVQGATLAPLIGMLHLDRYVPTGAPTLSESAARVRVIAAQVAAIERQSLAEDGTHRHPRLMEQYAYRARASARFDAAAGGLRSARAEHFTVILAAIAAGRAELLRMHRAGEIHDRVLRALEEELDLEELTARRRIADQEEE
jgi:CPA1 family monovalent cation:H+ antiporter